MRTVSYVIPLIVAASACGRMQQHPDVGDVLPPPPGFMSSEASYYSPTMRLTANVKMEDGGVLVIVVAGGRIAVPGSATGDTVPIMSALSIVPFMAVSEGRRDAVTNAQDAERAQSWRLVAQGDSVRLVTSLRYGESVSLPAMRWKVPVLDGIPADSAWLGFRVSGDAIEVSARTASGQAKSRTRKAGVRVFVCSEFSISGNWMRDRARALRADYVRSC